MLATVIAALVLIGAAAAVGTAICRIAGLSEVRGVAAAVGLAALMVVAALAVHLPGGATLAAVAVVVVAVAALAARPVRASLWAALPDLVVVTLGAVVVLCLPWLAAGRFGILGMGVNDDTGAHLVAVRWLVDHGMPVGDTLVADGYPLGPHALAAVVATAGAPVVAGLSAVAMTGPATAALAALDGVPVAGRRLRRALALTVGLSYLTVAYFAQMAFKETIVAALVLAFALVLPAVARAARRGRRAGARAALAPGLLAAGTVYTLSWPGALWPLAILAVCIAPALRRVPGAALVSGATAFAVLIAPELPRIVDFQASHYANEPVEGLGNLARPLPPYEALGVWLNRDFRFPPAVPALSALLIAAAAALAAVGVLAWLRRPAERPLAGALLAGWLVWGLLAVTKSGYTAAKGLVIVSPLVALAVVTGAVAAWRGRVSRAATPVSRRRGALVFGALGATPSAGGRRAAASVVLCAAALSSAWALRDAAVGPDAHHRELRALAAAAPHGPMLVLDSSDFAAWDLYGVDIWRPPLIYVVHTAPLRPEKPHRGGQPFDLDSVTSETLNRFASVVTARNAAGSAPPPGLRVLRTTRSYVLWQRVATVPPRETLGEGWQPGKILDCTNPSERALSRRKGWAIVRDPPVIASAPGWHGDARKAGSTATRTLSLPPGRWDLSLQYVSRNPIDVSVGGHTTTLPANLDRLGPLFAAGTTLGGRQDVQVRVHELPWLSRVLGAREPTRAFDSYRHQPLGALVATRHEAPERIPLSQACGRYVDSYALG